MNISLTPALEKLVAAKVKSGLYQTAGEVVREGLRLLIERDKQMESLRKDTLAGFEEIERGEYADYTAEGLRQLAEEVKSQGRTRLRSRAEKIRKK
jgi:antitoxin ParD1/3/4